MLQDAKELMSQVRDLKFALEESDQAAEHLASELAAAQVSMLRRGNQYLSVGYQLPLMLRPCHMPSSPSASHLAFEYSSSCHRTGATFSPPSCHYMRDEVGIIVNLYACRGRWRIRREKPRG